MSDIRGRHTGNTDSDVSVSVMSDGRSEVCAEAAYL